MSLGSHGHRMIAPKGYTPLAALWDKIPEADKDRVKAMFAQHSPPSDFAAMQMAPADWLEMKMLDAAQPELMIWPGGDAAPVPVGSGQLVGAIWEHLPSNADLMETVLDGQSLRERMPLDIARSAKLQDPNGPAKHGHHLLPLFWDRTSYSLSLKVYEWLHAQTEALSAARLAAGAPAEAMPEEWLCRPALDHMAATAHALRKLGAEGASLVIPASWNGQFWKRWRRLIEGKTEPQKAGRPPILEDVAQAYWHLFPNGHKAAGVKNWRRRLRWWGSVSESRCRGDRCNGRFRREARRRGEQSAPKVRQNSGAYFAQKRQPGHGDTSCLKMKLLEADMSNHNEIKLLRMREVIDLTGLSRASIYRRLKVGTFPNPVRLGENSIAWRSSEVAHWIDSLTPISG